MFPVDRPRRLRRTPALRRLVAETEVTPNDLILPLFVREGIDAPVPVSSLPGVEQHTLDSLAATTERAIAAGIPAVVLFGVPETKDATGTQASDPDGIVQRALRHLAARFGDDIVAIADLCIDEYTDHGHCGVIAPDGPDGTPGGLDNDATIERYAEIAVAQADAGADVVAPSGMMDGQVAAIRSGLDAAGHLDVPILAYAAKYASALYGPFRDAVDVEIVATGGLPDDRKGYQQDPANRREAQREIALDLAEGADMVMVKPALAYLDVIADTAAHVDVPVAAYHVSGEYAMVHAAAERGWVDGAATMAEHLLSIKRAGADCILTYAALDAADAWRVRHGLT